VPITINDVDDLVRLLEQNPDWQARLARALLNKQTLQRLLHEEPALAETLREALVSDKLDRLIAAVQELSAISRQSVERLDRHEAELQELRRAVAELVEISRQSVARIDALEQIVAQSVERLAASETLIAQSIRRLEALEELVQQVVRQLGELQSWQRGEAGNRDGERYQRSIRKQAWQLLNGGEGGETDEPLVEQKLRSWLIRNGHAIRPEPEANPVDADLIWWKGDKVAVIEVSITVDSRDVRRAAKHAQTLRAVGVDAFPIVIGLEWATPETQLDAQREGVEWKVGDDISDGVIEFRRLPNGE
jgi:hypothetical protein